MEITAAIEALRWIGESPCKVTLSSDSKYLVNGASAWLRNWKRNGWKRKDKKTKQTVPVLNVDLWQEIDRLMDVHRITWQYVKGHHTCIENNRCDALAEKARLNSASGAPRP